MNTNGNASRGQPEALGKHNLDTSKHNDNILLNQHLATLVNENIDGQQQAAAFLETIDDCIDQDALYFAVFGIARKPGIARGFCRKIQKALERRGAA